jgi:uncharacterized membrane protein
MDVFFDSVAALTAMGAGLSSLSGLRAFMPLALVGLISRLGLFGAFDLGGTPFAILENPWVIGILLVLAILEIVADKVPVVDSLQDVVAGPLRMLAGAIIFGAALAQQDTKLLVAGMVGGGALAGATHAAKGFIRPGATVVSGGTANPFISLFEDVFTFFGTVLVVILPILGLLLVLFVLFVIYRVRRRRRRKYKGLRILKE